MPCPELCSPVTHPSRCVGLWDITPPCPFSFTPVCYSGVCYSVFQRLLGDPSGKTLPQVLWELRGASATGGRCSGGRWGIVPAEPRVSFGGA